MMMDTIDLRSDTVSHPTPAMRQAMAEAVVGDDVYGEDPTVNALQDYAADLLGKEAGLFCTSGTQGNVIAVLTHCARGQELIVGKQAHIFMYEVGAASALGGISMNQISVQPDGTLALEDIRSNIRDVNNVHHPLTALVCLENTQGGMGGTPITAEYTDQVGALARQHNLHLHIDGARLFNAAAALNTPAKDLVRAADSVQICLSKGLCAPVGSLIVGSKEFIDRARRTRKVLGGGMRQAGVIAAAGLIALRDMRERLVEDHVNATALAAGLANIKGITVQPVHQRTNMVVFSLPADVDSAAFIAAMRAKKIILQGGPHFRVVTHYWITPERIQYVLQEIRAFMTDQRINQPSTLDAASKVIY